MKILILANSSNGLYNFRSELLKELIKNAQVSVSVPEQDKTAELTELGCNVTVTAIDRRGMNPASDLKLLRTYVKMIREIKPDVVLTYTVKPNVYGGLACRLTHMPYLSNITGLGTAIENGGILSRLTLALYKAGLKKAECVFFQNGENRKLFEQKKIVRGRTVLIPGSGVNLSRHCSENYPEDDGTVRFLFIGRVMKDKGIEELLEAMSSMCSEYDNVSLDIVGGFDENYSGLIDAAVNEGYVRYHGKQPDVHEYIRNSHCTVLPSYHEGMSNVMLESASTARPVITTRVPGCRETFDEGVTGIGCEAKSAASLKEAMVRFIELPYDEKKQMGIAGRRKMENEFDRDIVIRAYLDEIEKISKK